MRLAKSAAILTLLLVAVLFAQSRNIIPHSDQHNDGGFDEVALNTTQITAGTLPVARGGTGAAAFTQGSMVFAGPSGVYTQDNSNVFWDDTANDLGIGESSPLVRLHVKDGGGVPSLASASDTVAVFQGSAAAGSIARVSIISGTTAQSFLNLGDSADDDIGSINYNNNANAFSIRTNNVNNRLYINASGNVGINTNSPDELFHVLEPVDGTAILALFENSQANAAASLNETVQIHFGFGGDNDVARIVVGKLDDYFPGPAENDSFMSFYTDLNGTSRESMKLSDIGMTLSMPANITNDIKMLAGDDVDDLVRLLFRDNSDAIGWNILFDQSTSADEFIIQTAGGTDLFIISQDIGAHSFLGIVNQSHFVSFLAGDSTDDDVEVRWTNPTFGDGYILKWKQTEDDLVFKQVPGGADILTLPSDGGLKWHDNGAKPTCNAAHRGTIFYNAGGASVADTFEVCLKNAADAYNWRAMATP